MQFKEDKRKSASNTFGDIVSVVSRGLTKKCAIYVSPSNGFLYPAHMIDWLKKHRIGLVVPLLSGLLVAGTVYAITDIRFDLDTNEYVVNQNQRNVGNLSLTGDMTLVGNFLANTNQFEIEAATGRIGIGTTAPTTRLDIDGQIRIRGGAPAAGRLLTAGADGTATWEPPAGGGFLPTGTVNQTLRHSGTAWVATSNLLNDGTNVGLGITPTERLHVSGNILGTGWLRVADGTAALPALSFSTDPDTGIFRQALDVLGFTTAGVERARISATGLDIRTGGLLVNGTERITSAGALINIASLNTHVIPTGTGTLAVSATAPVTLSTAGTIGIQQANLLGTTNQVTVTGGTGVLLGTANATLTLPQDIHTGASPTFAGATLSGLTPGSVLFTGTGGIISQSNANLFWDSVNNRLGLGTTAPAGRLHVASGTLTASAPLTLTQTWNAAATTFDGMILDITDTASATGSGLFHVRGGSTGTTSMFFVRRDGNVGIGTTGPWARLQVQGAGTTSATSALNITDSAGTSTFLVRDDGNVGIGTTTPTERLHVVGNILGTGWLRVADGTAAAPTLGFASDPDTGIFRQALDVLGFTTAGVERARISATGLDIRTGGLLVNGTERITSAGALINIASLNTHVIPTGTGTLAVSATAPVTLSTAGTIGIQQANLLGTTNQVTVTGGTGVLLGTANATLTLPQDIHTGASPTFAGATLSGLTPGSVLFTGTGGIISQSNANLFWDSVNNRLGLGTTAPAGRLHVASGTLTASAPLTLTQTWNAAATTFDGMILDITDTASATGSGLFHVRGGSTGTTSMFFVRRDGNVGIGTTGPWARLQVQGAGTTSATSALNITDSAGTSTFLVRDDGNVGIGTTTPTERLHVVGNILGTGWLRVADGTAAAPTLGFASDPDTGIFRQALDVLGFTTAGLERLRVDATGNVGIGIAAPAARLDLGTASATNTVNAILARQASPGDPDFRLSVRSGTGTAVNTEFFRIGIDYTITRNAGISFFRGGAATGGFLTFDTNDGSERMRIDAAGNVGIGTTAPGARLDVEGTIRNRGGLIALSLATPSAPSVTPQGASGTTTWRYRITARSTAGETLASAEGTTTTGNATLSATNFNRVTWTAVPGAVDYRIYRTTAGGTPSTTGLIGTATALTFDDTGLAGSGTVPTIDTSGNVGLGTATPADRLDVIGNIRNLASSSAPPVRVGAVALTAGNDAANQVAVSGRYAYVVTGTAPARVIAIDISNPAAPVQIGSVTLSTGNDNGSAIAVSGRHAFITLRTTPVRVVAIDISNPAAPVQVGSVTLNTGENEVWSIAVSGRHAFVVTWTSPTNVVAINISDPTAPTRIGSVALPGGEDRGWSLAVSGRYAYVVTDTMPARVVAVDISNPAAPTRAGAVTMNTGEGNGRFIAVSGRHAYISTWSSPSQIIAVDISNPAAPARVGAVTLASGENDILSLDIAGRYLYATTLTPPARFVTIDVSNPASPTRIGAVTLNTGEDWGRSVAVSGRHAYVATETWPTRLVSVDISGIETTSAVVHSLEAGELQVRDSVSVQGNLAVASGIGVGSGGILSAGGIGIMGTATGGIRRLHVGATVAGSHPIATAWDTHSDRAFKNNIREIPYGLQEVLKLQPRAFNLNIDNSNSFGFIAQELKMILPEVVSGEEGQMGVSYGLLTAVLTRAIQEQQLQIDALTLHLGISAEGALTQNGTPIAHQPSATSFVERLRQTLATLSGRVVEAGWWAFDRITVRTARIERIEMVDQATGRIFCTWIENGEWKKIDSRCPDTEGPPVQDPPPVIPPPIIDTPEAPLPPADASDQQPPPQLPGGTEQTDPLSGETQPILPDEETPAPAPSPPADDFPAEPQSADPQEP
jgi:hypothetical protein